MAKRNMFGLTCGFGVAALIVAAPVEAQPTAFAMPIEVAAVADFHPGFTFPPTTLLPGVAVTLPSGQTTAVELFVSWTWCRGILFNQKARPDRSLRQFWGSAETVSRQRGRRLPNVPHVRSAGSLRPIDEYMLYPGRWQRPCHQRYHDHLDGCASAYLAFAGNRVRSTTAASQTSSGSRKRSIRRSWHHRCGFSPDEPP